MYQAFEVAVNREIEDGHGDEGEVNPEIIGKEDDKRVELAIIIVDSQGAPTFTAIRRITKTTWKNIKQFVY